MAMSEENRMNSTGGLQDKPLKLRGRWDRTDMQRRQHKLSDGHEMDSYSMQWRCTLDKPQTDSVNQALRIIVNLRTGLFWRLFLPTYSPPV